MKKRIALSRKLKALSTEDLEQVRGGGDFVTVSKDVVVANGIGTSPSFTDPFVVAGIGTSPSLPK